MEKKYIYFFYYFSLYLFAISGTLLTVGINSYVTVPANIKAVENFLSQPSYIQLHPEFTDYRNKILNETLPKLERTNAYLHSGYFILVMGCLLLIFIISLILFLHFKRTEKTITAEQTVTGINNVTPKEEVTATSTSKHDV